jgi:hypothetical protein
MSRRSHWMFRARRCSVESFEGRIIQRMTRDTTSGDAFADFIVDKKVKMGLGVVLWRARRWSVQRGILAVAGFT